MYLLVGQLSEYEDGTYILGLYESLSDARDARKEYRRACHADKQNPNTDFYSYDIYDIPVGKFKLRDWDGTITHYPVVETHKATERYY